MFETGMIFQFNFGGFDFLLVVDPDGSVTLEVYSVFGDLLQRLVGHMEEVNAKG